MLTFIKGVYEKTQKSQLCNQSGGGSLAHTMTGAALQIST